VIKRSLPELARHVRPTGVNVTVRARDDIDPSSDTVKVELSGKMVTALPENVGLCQVVDVGPDVTNVAPGDICFIDFFDVAEGYLVSGEEIYSTPAMSLRMTLDIQTEAYECPFTKREKLRAVSCDVTPLPGYVLTKHVPDRMTVAVTGCDRMILPRDQTTRGIVGGRNSDGDPCTFVVYEEVVKVGPGDIQCEREDGYTERKLKAQIQRLEAELRRRWAPVGAERPMDVAPGDLVTYCTEFSIQFRAMGELYRCVPYRNLLAVVDDRAILEAFNRTNPPAPLVHIIGGGASRLYGT
jgi:hypothetical protein